MKKKNIKKELKKIKKDIKSTWRHMVRADCVIKGVIEVIKEDNVELNNDKLKDNDDGIYTVYSDEGDMTFIMEQLEGKLLCKGFYFGEPNEEATEKYYGDYEADISDALDSKIKNEGL